MPSLLTEERRHAEDLVIPASKSAQDYVDWFLDQIMHGNQDETMNLIMQHTRVWGIACAVAQEMDVFYQMEKNLIDRKGSSLFGGKKVLTAEERAKLDVVRTVFLAKLLREIFVKDTNFTEVAYATN